MKRRMHNIFKRDGLSFILAMDHAAVMPSPDLNDTGHVIHEAIAGGVDAFLTTYGIIKHYKADFGNIDLVMRADGGISALRTPMNSMDYLYTAEDAVCVGADAILCMGFPGSEFNEHSLKYLAKLTADGDKYGLPVGAEMLPYGFEKHDGIDTRSLENVSFACRQGAELGADFIKTEFVGGERFTEITASCYVPVLVLGGGKVKPLEEVLVDIRQAIDCGAKGIIMGRNIYRHPNIAEICCAVAAVIHDGVAVEEALETLG
jgi:class I fructose-bisphosphate aldolase